MQEMDILDMNVLDETENDNGIPAEDYDDDENENFLGEEDAELNEDLDNRDFESEDEARHPEVRQDRKLGQSPSSYNLAQFKCCYTSLYSNRWMSLRQWRTRNIQHAHQSIWYVASGIFFNVYKACYTAK